jgi:hypothetical protein
VRCYLEVPFKAGLTVLNFPLLVFKVRFRKKRLYFYICLTPLPTLLLLCQGGTFYFLHRETIDLPDKLSNIHLVSNTARHEWESISQNLAVEKVAPTDCRASPTDLTWPDLVLTFALHTPQFQTCWLFPTFLSKKWSELTPISLINKRPFHRKVRIRYVEKNHVDKGFKQSINGKYSYHIYSHNETKIHWESLKTYTMPPRL